MTYMNKTGLEEPYLTFGKLNNAHQAIICDYIRIFAK